MSKRHISSYRIVCWRFTRMCNRTCSFCLSTSGPRQKNRLRDLKRYFDRFCHLGVEKLSYSGGEAILHPQFEEAVKLGDQKGLTQILTTNGDVLAKKWLPYLESLEYLKVSFYGSIHLHDRIMGAGNYESLLKLAKRLTNHGIIVGANYMLSADSLEYVKEFLYHACRAGITQILLLRYIPTGNSKVDSKYELGSEFRGRKGGEGLQRLAEELRPYAKMFTNGLKIHDYSYSSFFVVLTDTDELTLPGGQGRVFSLGHLFDEYLTVPGGEAKVAADALEWVWERRRITKAILPV